MFSSYFSWDNNKQRYQSCVLGNRHHTLKYQFWCRHQIPKDPFWRKLSNLLPPPPPNNTYPTKCSNAILYSSLFCTALYFQEWPLPLLNWQISVYRWTHLMSVSIMYQDQQLRIMPRSFLTRLRADCAMCRPSELSCFKPCDTSRAELHIVASLLSLKYMGGTNKDCVNNPYYCTVSCYISVILMPVSTTVSHKEHPFNHSCALFFNLLAPRMINTPSL